MGLSLIKLRVTALTILYPNGVRDAASRQRQSSHAVASIESGNLDGRDR